MVQGLGCMFIRLRAEALGCRVWSLGSGIEPIVPLIMEKSAGEEKWTVKKETGIKHAYRFMGLRDYLYLKFIPYLYWD